MNKNIKSVSIVGWFLRFDIRFTQFFHIRVRNLKPFIHSRNERDRENVNGVNRSTNRFSRIEYKSNNDWKQCMGGQWELCDVVAHIIIWYQIRRISWIIIINIHIPIHVVVNNMTTNRNKCARIVIRVDNDVIRLTAMFTLTQRNSLFIFIFTCGYHRVSDFGFNIANRFKESNFNRTSCQFFRILYFEFCG